MDTPAEVGKQFLQHSLFSAVPVDLLKIPVDQCDRGFFQTRSDFDSDGALAELGQSMVKTGGNYNPVIARQKLSGRYEIIAGERRLRAAISVGLDYILALVGDFDDEQAAVICITENLQRENLNAVEEAEGIRRMVDELDVPQKEIAALIGKSRPYVSNAIRLLTLDHHVKDLLKARHLDTGHAKALLALKSKQQQRQWGDRCFKQGWSVRELESRIRKLGQVSAPEDSAALNPDRDIARLEMVLSEEIGHPCRINFSEKTGAGKVSIRFASHFDFEGVIERLSPKLLDRLAELGFGQDENT